MKKQNKTKLALGAETIRTLRGADLDRAAGGALNRTQSACVDGYCGGGGGGGTSGGGTETSQCTNSFWGACQSAYC